MADIVPSLFGVTPQMYQRQQQDRMDAQALRFAQLDPFQQAQFSISRGANMLGGAIGGALGGQDPELQRITLRQQIAGSLDPSDLSTFDSGIDMLLRGGDNQGAFLLRAERDKVQQQLLTRQDQDLVRQDAAAKRAREAAALLQQQEAQRIAQGAFVPGGEAALYGRATQFPLLDDEGNVMPGAGVTQPSYDINRVAPQLMALGTAGQTQLLNVAKVNEEMAKAAEKQSQAISAQAKARFAVPTEQAAADKAVADAEKATSDAITAQYKARFAGPTAQAAADKAVADANKALADAQKATVEAQFSERLQQAGLNKTNWDITNLQSQIKDRSAKLALDQQTTAANVAEKMSSINKNLTDIPADSRKLINESATLAATAKQSADQFNNLASRIESQGGNYGVASSASDFLKKIGGFQGGMTQLKQEYARLRNTAAIKSLPPGPATDRDIQLALSGFPSDTARATDLSAFLRGMAKLQDIESAVANAKTDWLAQNNGTLTRTNRTLIVGDFSARPGESFNDLTARIAKDVNARYAGTGRDAQRQALINQIPTNRPAAAPASRDVISEADAILRGRK